MPLESHPISMETIATNRIATDSIVIKKYVIERIAIKMHIEKAGDGRCLNILSICLMGVHSYKT